MARFGAQLRHAWNAFQQDNEDKIVQRERNFDPYYGSQWGTRPDAHRVRRINDKTILTAILVRMAVDAALVQLRHVRLNDEGQYAEDIKSYLNECLTVEANIDQAAQAFFLDVYMSMFEDGELAIVPVDTTFNPNITGGWDVQTMRVGNVLQWYPKHVKVAVWDENTGVRRELILDKGVAAVIDNPFYAVMNDNASVLKRLARKLSILDTVDEASASGKLDILIQLPYPLRGPSKKRQAEDRQKELELQLRGSQYGIGYIDVAEKVVQLNRPAENNLQAQIEYLVNMVYTQFGLTPEIMNGSADEAAMLNYIHRTIAPVVNAVREGMVRTFLTKTARSQGQTIMQFQDPFKLVPLSKIGEIINVVSRNEVASPNEVRPLIGLKPSKDPNANKLQNSNMPGKGGPPQGEDPVTAGASGTNDGTGEG
jgi:hypothetical protein